VDFRAADRELKKLIHRRRPDALLMLGLAPTRKTLSLEAVALNVDHHEGPGRNESWLRPIQRDGPLAVEARLPLKRLQQRPSQERDSRVHFPPRGHVSAATTSSTVD